MRQKSRSRDDATGDNIREDGPGATTDETERTANGMDTRRIDNEGEGQIAAT